MGLVSGEHRASSTGCQWKWREHMVYNRSSTSHSKKWIEEELKYMKTVKKK